MCAEACGGTCHANERKGREECSPGCRGGLSRANNVTVVQRMVFSELGDDNQVHGERRQHQHSHVREQHNHHRQHHQHHSQHYTMAVDEGGEITQEHDRRHHRSYGEMAKHHIRTEDEN